MEIHGSSLHPSGGLVVRTSYCSFCTLPVKVYTKKHVAVLELAVFSLVSIIFTYLVWGEFHFIGLVVFTLLTMSAEVTHRMRWRSSIKCKGCGFDPVMYKNNPEQAASDVKDVLHNRKQDPLFMLKPRPKITPIVRKVKNYKPPVADSKDLQL